MPFDRTKFYLGANIGWLNEAYRHDMSYAFSDGWSPSPSNDTDFQQIMDAYLFHMSTKGIKVVRMWLLEQLEGMTFNGSTNGSTRTPPYSSTATFAFRDWSAFMTRITAIMRSAQLYRLQIYWCLLDAAALLPANSPPPWYRPLFAHIVGAARTNFENDIVNPFLEAINQYSANVFAIDLANEIDWAWHASGGMLPRATVVSFAHEVYNFIRAHSTHLVSTGFADYAQMTSAADFNFLDFFDYHRYFDPYRPADAAHGRLPNWTGPKACIIGEAGHEYAYSGGHIDENLQATSTRQMMYDALHRNYAGVLLWRYSPVGDNHRLLRLTAADRSLSTGSLPNFLTRFRAGASGTSTRTSAFAEFERPVWNEVDAFASTIPSDRRP